MKNEMIINENKGIEEIKKDLFTQTESKTYCSVKADTDETKKMLFNALENCDLLLNDIVNQEIVLKDVYCEEKEVLDEESGEIKTKFRTILFDIDGKTYATGAYGVYNSVKRIIQAYGYPTWENGIKVKVYKKSIKDNKTSLSLALV